MSSVCAHRGSPILFLRTLISYAGSHRSWACKGDRAHVVGLIVCSGRVYRTKDTATNAQQSGRASTSCVTKAEERRIGCFVLWPAGVRETWQQSFHVRAIAGGYMSAHFDISSRHYFLKIQNGRSGQTLNSSWCAHRCRWGEWWVSRELLECYH